MFTKKRSIILCIIIIAGFVLWELAILTFMNLLLGGILFGYNILWKTGEEKEDCFYYYVQ